MPDINATAIVSIAPTNVHVRWAGTGLWGWAAFTLRTAQRQTSSAGTMPSVTSGSNDQPNVRLTASGGSAGVGPCASAGSAVASHRALTASTAIAPRNGAPPPLVRIARILARDRAVDTDGARCSGYHGQAPPT